MISSISLLCGHTHLALTIPLCLYIPYNKGIQHFRGINTYDESSPCVSRNAAAF
jgi:hypothetical protein